MVVAIAEELARAVDGAQWDAARVGRVCQDLASAARRASPAELAAALDHLVDRLERARPDDADGVAHVAISGGTLVERGAPPRRLGEVLRSWSAGRTYAALRSGVEICEELPPPRVREILGRMASAVR